MKTIYDWISLGIFAGLVVLFLQRSTGTEEKQDDPLILYLVAGAACGVANYLGDNGQDILAALLIAGTVGFIFYFLKPFDSIRKR
jgi:uncharacterized oligopeptide transporter (OPT) family protein